MIDVVLLYEDGCPHVAATRQVIQKAMAELELSLRVREVERNSEELPESWRSFGSPTVLVNGLDVMGALGGQKDTCTCRLYPGVNGSFTGVPPIDRIALALGAAADETEEGG